MCIVHVCGVCVCVGEEERKREGGREGEREGGGKRGMRGVCACVRV